MKSIHKSNAARKNIFYIKHISLLIKHDKSAQHGNYRNTKPIVLGKLLH